VGRGEHRHEQEDLPDGGEDVGAHQASALPSVAEHHDEQVAQGDDHGGQEDGVEDGHADLRRATRATVAKNATVSRT
jgi:hypothetical protein